MIGLTFPLPALFALMSAAHSAEPGVQAPEASRHVVFSHGQESGPWGRKISALAEVARSEGYVAVTSASLLHARGVFLMAPALYMQGLPELRASVLDCPAAVVHGWRDEVVPFEHSVRFAQAYRAALHLLESDHRLHNQIRVLHSLFDYSLPALHLHALASEQLYGGA